MHEPSVSYEELVRRIHELQEESSKRRQAEEFAEAVLNSLSAHIAILDENGVIVATNRAWKEFARANHIKMRPDTVGANYIEICKAARGDSSECSSEVARGISDVLTDRTDEFVIDYPCHSPLEKRWFYMRVTRLSDAGPVRLVVSHENITALKRAEEALKKREQELEDQASHLRETNTALKVLLKSREEDKRELEENVLRNIKNSIKPYLHKLEGSRLDASQKEYLRLAASQLDAITSSFSRQLSSDYLNFTPQEIQVATLVRDGKSSKEIAGLLNISMNAVHFHRKNIRGKLGLKNKKASLRSHLLSLGS
jgi:DNA-binding CsgD family transcriptional regulator